MIRSLLEDLEAAFEYPLSEDYKKMKAEGLRSIAHKEG